MKTIAILIILMIIIPLETIVALISILGGRDDNYIITQKLIDKL